MLLSRDSANHEIVSRYIGVHTYVRKLLPTILKVRRGKEAYEHTTVQKLRWPSNNVAPKGRGDSVLDCRILLSLSVKRVSALGPPVCLLCLSVSV